jgi:hypothetical protein
MVTDRSRKLSILQSSGEGDYGRVEPSRLDWGSLFSRSTNVWPVGRTSEGVETHPRGVEPRDYAVYLTVVDYILYFILGCM